MPSRYSHALVLSHYESQGLIEPDGRVTKKADSRSSIISARSTPIRSTHRPNQADTAQTSRSSPASPQPFSSPRIRLGASTPYTRIEVSPPPLHRKTSSVQTQIFAPPSPPPTRDHQTHIHFENRPHAPKHQTSVETQIYNPQSPSPRSSQSRTSMTDWSRSSEVKARRRAAQVSSPNRSRFGSRNVLFKESGNKSPEKPQSPLLTHASQENASSEAQAFHPSRPPSPPATPDSVKSFGLETHLDCMDKKLPHPTAAGSSDIVDLKASSDRLENSALRRPSAVSGHSEASSESLLILPRVPPNSGKFFGLKKHIGTSGASRPASQAPVSERSVLQSQPKSPKSDRRATSQPPPGQPSTSQNQEPRAYHLPTFSMTTQPSSHGSITSPMSDLYPDPLEPKKAASFHSPTLSITATPLPSNAEQSRPRTSRSAHGPRFSVSTRRSSLNFANAPPDLARTSSIPTGVSMPTEAFFDHDDDADLESLPPEVDFDSMPWTDLNANPIIVHNEDERGSTSSRASSFDSAAPPPIRRAPNYPMLTEKPIPKPSKISRHSLSALLFSRAPTPPPKAILYSETMPGPPPISVGLSGKDLSSKAATFSTSPARWFQPQQKSEERVGRQMSMSGANSVPYAPPRRGVSQGAAERRGLWFKNEADRAFGNRQSVRKKAIDEIVRANSYL